MTNHEKWLNNEITLTNRQLEERERIAEARGVGRGMEHKRSAPETVIMIKRMEDKIDKIFEELNRRHEIIIRTQDQVESIAKKFNDGEIIHEIKENVKKTNGRVNNLENWRNYIAGALAIIGIVMTLLIRFAGTYFDDRYVKNADLYKVVGNNIEKPR